MPHCGAGEAAIATAADESRASPVFCLELEALIEVPVIPWHNSPNRLIRVSAQVYNTLADYEVLSRALMKLLAEL